MFPRQSLYRPCLPVNIIVLTRTWGRDNLEEVLVDQRGCITAHAWCWHVRQDSVPSSSINQHIPVRTETRLSPNSIGKTMVANFYKWWDNGCACLPLVRQWLCMFTFAWEWSSMFTVGDTMVVVGLEQDSQTHYSCDITEVQYWTWVSSDTLAFVTDNDVLHWTVAEGIFNTDSASWELYRFGGFMHGNLLNNSLQLALVQQVKSTCTQYPPPMVWACDATMGKLGHSIYPLKKGTKAT